MTHPVELGNDGVCVLRQQPGSELMPTFLMADQGRYMKAMERLATKQDVREIVSIKLAPTPLILDRHVLAETRGLYLPQETWNYNGVTFLPLGVIKGIIGATIARTGMWVVESVRGELGTFQGLFNKFSPTKTLEELEAIARINELFSAKEFEIALLVPRGVRRVRVNPRPCSSKCTLCSELKLRGGIVRFLTCGLEHVYRNGMKYIIAKNHRRVWLSEVGEYVF